MYIIINDNMVSFLDILRKIYLEEEYGKNIIGSGSYGDVYEYEEYAIKIISIEKYSDKEVYNYIKAFKANKIQDLKTRENNKFSIFNIQKLSNIVNIHFAVNPENSQSIFLKNIELNIDVEEILLIYDLCKNFNISVIVMDCNTSILSEKFIRQFENIDTYQCNKCNHNMVPTLFAKRIKCSFCDNVYTRYKMSSTEVNMLEIMKELVNLLIVQYPFVENPHCDIRLPNILSDDLNKLKLCDLSISYGGKLEFTNDDLLCSCKFKRVLCNAINYTSPGLLVFKKDKENIIQDIRDNELFASILTIFTFINYCCQKNKFNNNIYNTVFSNLCHNGHLDSHITFLTKLYGLYNNYDNPQGLKLYDIIAQQDYSYENTLTIYQIFRKIDENKADILSYHKNNESPYIDQVYSVLLEQDYFPEANIIFILLQALKTFSDNPISRSDLIQKCLPFLVVEEHSPVKSTD